MKRFRMAIFIVAVSSAVPIWGATCTWVQSSATVCTTDIWGTSCETTFYSDWVCGYDSGPTSGGGGSGGSGGGNALDSNGNNVIDSWTQVVNTPDPCSNNFDSNDRLGSNFGGPNTTRAGHTGVDIQGDYGNSVHAMKSGIVATVGDANACGWAVTINFFDGTSAVYCHLNPSNQDYLSPGDAVVAGGWIGNLAPTGNITGAHLHLVYKDPQGNRREYFNYTENTPSGSNLNSGGC